MFNKLNIISDNRLYLRSKERKYSRKGTVSDTDLEKKRKRPPMSSYAFSIPSTSSSDVTEKKQTQTQYAKSYPDPQPAHSIDEPQLNAPDDDMEAAPFFDRQPAPLIDEPQPILLSNLPPNLPQTSEIQIPCVPEHTCHCKHVEGKTYGLDKPSFITRPTCNCISHRRNVSTTYEYLMT